MELANWNAALRAITIVYVSFIPDHARRSAHMRAEAVSS
jgi:hypothetical protein